jgi:hypothetical protein
MRLAMVVVAAVLGCGSELSPAPTAHPSPVIASFEACGDGGVCDGGTCTIFLSPEVGDQTPRCVPPDQNACALLSCDAPATCFEWLTLPGQLECGVAIHH